MIVLEVSKSQDEEKITVIHFGNEGDIDKLALRGTLKSVHKKTLILKKDISLKKLYIAKYPAEYKVNSPEVAIKKAESLMHKMAYDRFDMNDESFVNYVLINKAIGARSVEMRTATGAGAGAAAGATAGAVVGLVAGPLGVLVGAGVGALIGSAFGGLSGFVYGLKKNN